jgi:hypothetical protein
MGEYWLVQHLEKNLSSLAFKIVLLKYFFKATRGIERWNPQ